MFLKVSVRDNYYPVTLYSSNTEKKMGVQWDNTSAIYTLRKKGPDFVRTAAFSPNSVRYTHKTG